MRVLTLFCLFAFIFSGCSNTPEDENKPTGKLDLNLGISVQTYDVYNSLKAAEPDEFIVMIYDEGGGEVLSFSRAADMPDVIELHVGNYYVVAHSGNNAPAAFENDYYYGESELFSITAGETTPVSLTCVLSNIMVTVVYASTVVSDFDTYSTTVSNGGGSLVFDETETRAGFFDQGPLSIEAVLTYTNGMDETETITLTGSISAPETGKHYEIHIEASLDDGYGIIELLVDESYDTEIVTLNDEAPEMTGELLITEIMYNPVVISDTEGEYIEVKNVSDATVSLMNLVIRRGSNDDTHTISEDISLLPGEIALLGRSASAAPEVDYVYATITLLNSGDAIYLNTYGTDGTDGDVICMVDYGADGFNTSLNGASLQLDPAITDATEAQLGTNWCESTVAYDPGDNLGSPGDENNACP